jgi:hypothetical protein
MDDFLEPSQQSEVPADDSFGTPAEDMGGMDMGSAPPLADSGGFGDADFGGMGGAPPLGDAGDMFGGAPPLENTGADADDDAFGLGGGAPPLGGSADDFGMGAHSDPMRGMGGGDDEMGGMDMGGGMGGMDMGGMAAQSEEQLPVFGEAAPASAMPDFSSPTVSANGTPPHPPVPNS